MTSASSTVRAGGQDKSQGFYVYKKGLWKDKVLVEKKRPQERKLERSCAGCSHHLMKLIRRLLDNGTGEVRRELCRF